jgi:hypothetical protein
VIVAVAGLLLVLVTATAAVVTRGHPTRLHYPEIRALSASTMPPPPRPGYLSPTTDRVFATSIVRISDQAAFGSSDPFLRNSYAKMQPWNADGTRVLLSYTKTGYVLDGDSYRLLDRVPLNSVGDAVWSNVDPDVIYRSEGNALVRVSASSGAVTRLHTFEGYSSVVVGGGEGSPSNDDRYLALLGTSPAGESGLVYDLRARRLVGERLLGPPNSVDWVAMSQSGEAVVVSYFADGPGPKQGVAVFDRSMHPLRHLADSSEHADLGRTIAGTDVYVTIDYRGSGERILSYPLDGAPPTVDLVTDGVGTHVSCRNTSRPGWCYLSDTAVDRPGSPGSGVVLAFALDGSRATAPFAHEYQSRGAPYGSRAFAVPNRTGDRVLFGSDWLGGPTAPGYAYVAWAPPPR